MIMRIPICLIDDDVRRLPDLVGVANAASMLFEKDHIKAIAAQLRRSYEHTCLLADYAKETLPHALIVFQRYGASAFDEGTVQDLKHHHEADEFYLALRGSFRVLWKAKGSQKLQQDRVLHVSVESSPWAYIPAGYCLLVASDCNSSFLAVAFKTKESNIKNGGKQLGKICEYYKDQTCPHRDACETFAANRAQFFDTVEIARCEATNRANNIAESLLIGNT